MSTTRTFGRLPTLTEMNEYYAREDVLDFFYDECQRRNIDIAFRRKRWTINPTSKIDLRKIINDTVEKKIKRGYQANSENIDGIRLEKCDYLSFHSHTSIVEGNKLVGFDLIFEADMQGWRRAFEDLCGVVQILDDFEVCYRIKYSGVRSLHLMIPFESFPKQFNGEPILNQREEIRNKLQGYFRRHGGMQKAHGGGVMRLAYSLNEDNGLVSLPILSHRLSDFRPWKANIYHVAVDKPWHSDVPSKASWKMLRFLREVYNDEANEKKRRARTINFGLEIAERNRRNYATSSSESIEQYTAQLKSDEPAVRAEAAFLLMTSPEPVPSSVLRDGLSDDNADVRWFLAESLQKLLDSEAIDLGAKLLWDEDQFVRISAIDALALSGKDAIQALSNAMSSDISASVEALNDVVYAIYKICPESELVLSSRRRIERSEAVQSFVKSSGDAIARFLQNTIDSSPPHWIMRRYFRQLRELCKQYDIAEIEPFYEAIKMLVPQLLKSFSIEEPREHQISTLQEIRKNEAIPLMTMHEIADSLGIDKVKIPKNRMTEEERAFLTQVVRESLSGMNVEQKARILVAFWLHGKKKLSEPAGNLLLYIDKSAAVTVITQALAYKDFGLEKSKNIMGHLKRIDPSALESVTEWMNNATIQSGVLFSASVKKLVQENSVDELVEMLSQNWSARRNAAYALAHKCNSDEDIDKVINVLRHPNNKVRVAAVHALGAMPHHPKALTALIGALNASRFQVRRAALQTYVRLNPPDAIDVLFQVIQRRDSYQVKLAAIKELRRYMNDEHVWHKLREVHADDRCHRKIRATAERLLRQIPK